MKKLSLYIPVYSLTLLLSASLLFSVQPMFSKMILPLLGGTPQVWNTAMLFFQIMLLGGYAYAHGTTKYLSVRTQAIVHIILLLIFIAVLPFGIPEGWVPPVDKDPTLWQLSLMAVTVGGPFFVLAGSAPMLQRWFAGTDHPDSENPYFLYGASNLGSMTALLAYPTIIEPLMDLPTQSYAWMIGYFALIAFTAFSAGLAGNQKNKIPEDASPAAIAPLTWLQRLQWIILSFIPSSLMLGVTTFITTDIAAVPLLWILPLALYVGTFIIVFARRQIVNREMVFWIQGILLVALIVKMMLHGEIRPEYMIVLHLSLFFFSALACHMELARSRPDAAHLTEFYLIMSIGGAIGGIFNAIIAPVYFIIPLEYALVLAIAMFLRYATDDAHGFKITLEAFRVYLTARKLDAVFSWQFLVIFLIIFTTAFSFSVIHVPINRLCAAVTALCLLTLLNYRWMFAMMATFVLIFFPPGYEWGNFLFKDTIHRDRNFFGVIKVVDSKFGERLLLHGTTNHGAQALDPSIRLTPLSYYSKFSPINDAFHAIDSVPAQQEVAVLGLGIGVTACFQKDGRHFDFFEIDHAIAAVAEDQKLFTFLSDCKSPYDIILGDGRLTVQKKPDHHYDLILLDAFSSDNIPVHLLTAEAIELYLSKLKPDGILVFNVSNNYLDIEPVLAMASEKLGVPGYAHVTTGGKLEGTDIYYYAAHFFVFTKNEKYISYLKERGWSEARKREGVKLWTDRFSNIFSVLGNRTGRARFEALKEKHQDEEKAQGQENKTGGKK